MSKSFDMCISSSAAYHSVRFYETLELIAPFPSVVMFELFLSWWVWPIIVW